MKALITGCSGTVGSALKSQLETRGWTVLPWLRQETPVDQPQAHAALLDRVRPDALFHLAVASQGTGMADEGRVVSCSWTDSLAQLCAERDIRFVFTSTAMVFSNDAKGPFTRESEPDAPEGYGYEKRLAEQSVAQINPKAWVARLGWQIGERPGSNNMIDFFHQRMQEDGVIRASSRWYPACSFLGDTCEALVGLLDKESGLYMVDANKRWTFYDIARALNQHHGGAWRVEESTDFVYDQRMLDDRVVLPALEVRLPGLVG